MQGVMQWEQNPAEERYCWYAWCCFLLFLGWQCYTAPVPTMGVSASEMLFIIWKSSFLQRHSGCLPCTWSAVWITIFLKNMPSQPIWSPLHYPPWYYLRAMLTTVPEDGSHLVLFPFSRPSLPNLPWFCFWQEWSEDRRKKGTVFWTWCLWLLWYCRSWHW